MRGCSRRPMWNTSLRSPGPSSSIPPRSRQSRRGPGRSSRAGWQTGGFRTRPKYPSLDDIHRVYDRGMTVIIMTMQQRWAPVATLCRELEAFFRCPVHANLYLTPEGAQGFDAHFDTHEVFVLQLEGAKQWRLFGAPRPLPLVDERFDVPRNKLGPPREVQLEAGDLLYIPRGFVHEAFTSEQASLHLTVGVNVYRWADLLGEARRRSRGKTSGSAKRYRARCWVRPVWPRPFASDSPSWSGVGRGADVEKAVGKLGDQFFGQLLPCPARGSPRPTEVKTSRSTRCWRRCRE